MSQEKKEAQSERERLIKNAKRQMETQEECDKRRKINRDSMMRKRQTETEEIYNHTVTIVSQKNRELCLIS